MVLNLVTISRKDMDKLCRFHVVSIIAARWKEHVNDMFSLVHCFIIMLSDIR